MRTYFHLVSVRCFYSLALSGLKLCRIFCGETLDSVWPCEEKILLPLIFNV